MSSETDVEERQRAPPPRRVSWLSHVGVVAVWVLAVFAWRRLDAHGFFVVVMLIAMFGVAVWFGYREGLRAVAIAGAAFTIGLGAFYVATGRARRTGDRPPCSLDSYGWCHQTVLDQLSGALPAGLVVLIAGTMGALIRGARKADDATAESSQGAASGPLS